MNISEANDTNAVLRYLVRGEGEPDRVCEAAARLAGRAHKALHAGMRPEDVTGVPPIGRQVAVRRPVEDYADLAYHQDLA